MCFLDLCFFLFLFFFFWQEVHVEDEIEHGYGNLVVLINKEGGSTKGVHASVAIVVQKDLLVDVSLAQRKLYVSTQKGLVIDVGLTQGRLDTGVIASVSTPMSIVDFNILVYIVVFFWLVSLL